MADKKYLLYFHRNPITNIVFYVGIGSNGRQNDFNKRSKYWHSYVKKHGLPIVEVVKRYLNKIEAYHLEIHYISYFGRKRFDENGILVNLTNGGDGLNGMTGVNNPNFGKPLSESAKEKLRSYAGENHPNRGRKHTESARKKISEKAIGRKHPMSPETRSKLSILLSGKKRTQETLDKMSAAMKGRVLSEDHKTKLRGRVSPRKGVILTQETKDRISNSRIGKYGLGNNPRAKSVINHNTGELYSCAQEAANKLGIRGNYLRSVLNGCIKTNNTGLTYLNN